MAVENNSYSSVEDADAYFEQKLFAESWASYTEDKRQQALNQATQLIDLFNYIGERTEDSQNHAFPRTGITLDGIELSSTDIPEGILFAQYEIALALAKGVDPEREIRQLYVLSRGYSSVRTTYDPSRIPEHLKYGIPSALGWNYLLAFLDRESSGMITLHRVS